jgi:subtilisin family serine protease
MDTFGHGTHVAATAAGYSGWTFGADGIPNNADDVALHGVAPQAQLMAYQVCNIAGSCVSPAILLALEDAVSPRSLTGFAKPIADVINLSLGGAGGPDDASSVGASNAALAGAVVVAAAGNDGPGQGTIGSPAAGRHVIAVAASNDPGVIPNSVSVVLEDGTDGRTVSAALSTDSNLTQPITESIVGNYVFAGLADTPTAVPLSVFGNICLVARGSTLDVAAADAGTGLFANKAANCQAKGAIGTVVFNDTPGEVGAVLAPAATPVLTISGDSGTYLQALGYDEDGISLSQMSLNGPDASLFVPGIAGFSSVGPIAGEGQIKADLAAPGVAILAATTKTGPPTATMADASGYTEANGTSMASPHVAGAAALVIQVNPSWEPETVRAALMNTATNPRFGDGTPKADGESNDSILAQGAGLIDVFAAANTKAIMGIASPMNPDALDEPTFLASYSYGTFPMVNTRIKHAEDVIVTLQGLNASETTYNLSFANNRELEADGIDVALSAKTITVSGDNFVQFKVFALIDGDTVRDFGDASQLQMMWYVIAEPEGGGATLRMPFYLKASMSEPAVAANNGVATVLAQPETEFTNSAGQDVDFDGEFTLQWDKVDDAVKFEIEQSTDGVNFTSVEVMSADTTSYALTGLGNDTYSYRVKTWFDGKIGAYISSPSNVVDVLVDLRSQVDITAQIKTNISNYDLGNGISSLDLSITNKSDNNFVPKIELQAFDLQSNSGTVRLLNAENGGSAIGEDRGMFDYSQTIGSDDTFTANETSDAITLQFSNAQSELYFFDVSVLASEQSSSTSTSASNTQEESAGQPTLVEQVLRVTVNPLTGSVTTELVTSSPLNVATAKPLRGL